MKRAISILTIGFILAAGAFAGSAAAQTASDYVIIGDVRAGLPGPDIIDSSYTRNPAACALNIHSSLMVGGIMLPSHLEGSSLPVGMFTALSLPNFSLMNTSLSFGLRDGESVLPVTKNLIGLQFGLSTQDLGMKLPVTVALGLGGYSEGELRGEAETGSFVADLGGILVVESLVVEALLQNIYRYSLDGASSFAGPSAEYKLKIKTKIILDIFFAAGLSTANNIPETDFIMEFQMYRFFFSESLRTGIELKIQGDVAGAEFLIPGQSYGFTIAYFLPELVRSSGGGKTLARIQAGLNGFALNARGMVTITETGCISTASPLVSLGLSRFF